MERLSAYSSPESHAVENATRRLERLLQARPDLRDFTPGDNIRRARGILGNVGGFLKRNPDMLVALECVLQKGIHHLPRYRDKATLQD